MENNLEGAPVAAPAAAPAAPAAVEAAPTSSRPDWLGEAEFNAASYLAYAFIITACAISIAYHRTALNSL